MLHQRDSLEDPCNAEVEYLYLVVRDWDRVVNQVSDCAQLGVPQSLLGLDIELQSILLLLAVGAGLDELRGILLFLLFKNKGRDKLALVFRYCS